jgi:ABC transporter substrate binding protein
MRRREFITLLGGAAAAWPVAARAQQPAKPPTIGALVIGNTNPEQFWREFRQGLRDLGYIEGQNIRFEFRSAAGQADRLPELAAELVRLKVNIVVTWFTPAALAAKQATREIPIVMADTGDPVGNGTCGSDSDFLDDADSKGRNPPKPDRKWPPAEDDASAWSGLSTTISPKQGSNCITRAGRAAPSPPSSRACRSPR